MINRIDWYLLGKSFLVGTGIFLAFLIKSLIIQDDSFFETNALLTWIPIILVETVILYFVTSMRNTEH